jgi:hypothetical protein
MTIEGERKHEAEKKGEGLRLRGRGKAARR